MFLACWSRVMKPTEKDVFSTGQPASMPPATALWRILVRFDAAEMNAGWDVMLVGRGTIGPGGRQSKWPYTDNGNAAANMSNENRSMLVNWKGLVICRPW